MCKFDERIPPHNTMWMKTRESLNSILRITGDNVYILLNIVPHLATTYERITHEIWEMHGPGNYNFTLDKMKNKWNSEDEGPKPHSFIRKK